MIQRRKLQRPDYIILDAAGRVTQIFCKVCGTQIGQMNKIGRMVRTSEYIEAKIQCTDGSFHHTNGCDKCLHQSLPPSMLRKLMQADARYDPVITARRGKPARVVQLGLGMV